MPLIPPYTDAMSAMDRDSPEARRARRLRQAAWLILAVAVLVPVLVLAVLALLEVKSVEIPYFFVVTFWTVPMTMAFGLLLYRSRQHAVVARARNAATDARPPVLYLRSFSRDLTALKGAFLLQGSPALGTMEEQLREALAPIGPLIAVGLPGESLPPPGAQRIYLDDEDWRAKVERLMASATLVIILVGKAGAGLGWEIQCAFDRVDRSRLLLLVTRGRRQYETARESIERAAAVELPPYRRVRRVFGPPPFIGANCFLAFPPGGGVTVLRLRAPFLRGLGLLTAEVRYALKPVFERLGVPWSPPPISIANIIAATAIAAFLVMLLVL